MEKKTYLLLDERGYYWMWHNFDGKPNLSGPHSEKMLNMEPIKVENPLSFDPAKHAKKPKK